MSTAPAGTAFRHQIIPRRGVVSTILSDFGWIDGTFVIPKLNSFVDYLNSSQRYVKLTDVTMPGLEPRLPFFALAQDAYTLILPDANDEHLASAIPHVQSRTHSISCVFASGWISGKLDTIPSARVSDFLGQGREFFLLRDCAIQVRGQAPRLAPIVIVNSARILGVSEPTIEAVKDGHVRPAVAVASTVAFR
jgi:hypothetical protein